MGRMFCDIYNPVNPSSLDSNESMTSILQGVVEQFQLQQYEQKLIPCQDLPDPGVSGVVLAPGFHFTCHTFSRRDVAYLDTFSVRDFADGSCMEKMVEAQFVPECIISHSSQGSALPGHFGRHLIFTMPPMPFEMACGKIEETVQKISMHHLAPVMTLQHATGYDILQPIVESHIAAHAQGQSVEFDIFSCNYFDDRRALALFPGHSDPHIIPRNILERRSP